MALAEYLAAETLWEQLGWIALLLFSLYMISVYGEAMRYSVRGRLTAAMSIIREDIGIIAGAVIAVSTFVLGVINPINLGAAAAGLTELIAPLWMFVTSFAISLANLLGAGSTPIEMVVLFSIIVGIVAFIVRQLVSSNPMKVDVEE